MSESTSVKERGGEPIRVLTKTVARRIAAGEVIDRPYAAVRELLDNAVDSRAGSITLHLDGGGVDGIRVIDDGCGMGPDDLELCWLPHATSKISTLQDLEKVSTLGFRGEALSSLAACSRLEIVTAPPRGKAHRLWVHGGKKLEFGPATGAPGTTVSVRDLFFNMPARRRFLKSKRVENTLCRRIFLEKAAAHPGVAFRLFVDGVLKIFLPVGSFTERILAAWPRIAPAAAWWETRGEGDGFKVVIVHARPEVSRKDRKYIQIYANRRRIDEFSLVQGVDYAYDAWMPGGVFPMAFVFIEIDPALVDFNIHPAKKEARFRDLPAIRHRIIDAIRDCVTGDYYRARASDSQSSGHVVQSELPSFGSGRNKKLTETAHPFTGKPSREQSAAFAAATGELRNQKSERERRIPRFSPKPVERDASFRYLGQVMGVFLVAESADSLFIVDQHAAHEKILFEQFCRSDAASERLLIPRPLDLDDAARMRLELRREKLESLGLAFDRNPDGNWFLTALPQAARGLEDKVAAFIEAGAGDADGFEKELWADLACKAAVKDNAPLDDEGAKRLLTDAFALEIPRCPHGRPIWFEVSREELFALVGRSV